MSIQIISVGKKHEDWVKDGIERYQQRLKRPFDIEWVLLPHSSHDGLKSRQEESSAILKRLNANDFVVLLDERGLNIASPELATKIEGAFNQSKNIIFIIGGAYGVSDELITRASFSWSLSKLVFPHQLVRLILTEQIYRAQEIAGGRSYHHE